MRHEEHRLADLPFPGEKLLLERAPRDGVERAERLVHEHEGRIGRERPCDPDPLALAARKLARPAGRELAGGKVHHREELFRASAAPLLAPAEQAGHDRDVLLDVPVRKKSALLDHVADPAAQRDRVLRRHVPSIDSNLARVRRDEPVHEPQGGRLPRSRRADERHRLPAGHGKREAVEDHRARDERLPDVAKLHGGRGN